MSERKPTKLQRLKAGLGSGGQSLEEIEQIAKSIGAWEDRFAARPAAEMLIEQGTPGADAMEKTLEGMPFTGTDERADILRAACRAAMERDGIPAEVERNARAFYERSRGHRRAETASAPTIRAGAESSQPIEPEGSLDFIGAIASVLRRLFGR